jgi:hypothetical protein
MSIDVERECPELGAKAPGSLFSAKSSKPSYPAEIGWVLKELLKNADLLRQRLACRIGACQGRRVSVANLPSNSLLSGASKTATPLVCCFPLFYVCVVHWQTSLCRCRAEGGFCFPPLHALKPPSVRRLVYA